VTGALESLHQGGYGGFQARVSTSGRAGAADGYNGPVQLTEKQRRHLKGLAHSLNPVIQVGNAGVTPSVIAETRRALADHELIKVRVSAADREQRDAAIQLLAAEAEAALVGRIGHVATLYRPHPKLPRILLPAPPPAP
jgi:RNA-binding protein